MKSARSPVDLIEVFSAAVIAQDECIAQGDAKNGNRYAKRYIKAAQDLLCGGIQSIDNFAGLLQHDKPSVRATAAAYLLKDRIEESVSVLRTIADGVGLAALGAQMTLKRYDKGELEIQ